MRASSVVGVGTVCAVSACAAAGSPLDGAVSGGVYREGGPLLGNRPACSSNRCPATGAVTIVRATGGERTPLRVRLVHGRFRTRLSQGTYRISAGLGCRTARIVIRAHRTSHTVLRCDIR